MRITRRFLLSGGSLTATLAVVGGWRLLATGNANAAGAGAQSFEVTLSDEAWRQKLTPAQYTVLRHEGTERPFSSPLNDEHRKGVFSCAG
ncbi:MAG TPA: peptide-methionine (R)-S-oxide reductase, partial [Cupriavidus sp.]|nr:peptide-methionine (R)-S-oxide reductase [Cupriavidus sp.]